MSKKESNNWKGGPMDQGNDENSNATAPPQLTTAGAVAHPKTPSVGVTSSKQQGASSASSAAVAVSSSGGSRSAGCVDPATLSGKKRPYRRSKRPVGYCDKSTVTTTTEEVTSLNVYDAVLHESQDLLAAASEAQQLGRLKMASAYMLLLHARLVGLGKRFDKAERQPKDKSEEDADGDGSKGSFNEEEGFGKIAAGVVAGASEATGSETGTPAATSSDATPQKNPEPPAAASLPASITTATPLTTESTHSNHSRASAASGGKRRRGESAIQNETPKTAAAKQLASMLPSNIEMDQAMMEHLAKAAAELHAARCGRKRQNLGGDLLKGTDAREFLAGTSNQQGLPSTAATGIAWSGEEVGKLNEALASGTKDPKQIATITGRSEQQVKAYLRNQDVKARVEADLELPTASDEGPKKKGGRGKKPATTAMDTVPNAICDARALLQGGILEES